MTATDPEGITMTTDPSALVRAAAEENHDEASCLFCKAGEPMAHNYEPDNGNDQARPSVAEYVEQHNIVVNVTSDLGIHTEMHPGDRPWDHFLYRITLRRPGTRAWSHIMWRTGMAHTGGAAEVEAKPADVFDALLREGAYAAYTTDSFEDWADELGYDTDSYRARKAYRACVRTWDRMCEFLGGEAEAIRVFTRYDSL